jgi:hypothetical protein
LLNPGNLVWALIALMGVVSVLFYLTTGDRQRAAPRSPSTPEPSVKAEPAPPPPSAPPKPFKSTLEKAPEPAPVLVPPPTASQVAPWSAPSTPDTLPAALPSPEFPVPARKDTFAGSWFYAPPKEPAPSKDLYPPEYIELKITDEGGLVRGRYRARYHITDRPVSPEVVFRFEGPVSSNIAQLRWAAPNDGAKGEVQLKLLSPNSMQVNWWATELGKNPSFASGTAVLIRQQEP